MTCVSTGHESIAQSKRYLEPVASVVSPRGHWRQYASSAACEAFERTKHEGNFMSDNLVLANGALHTGIVLVEKRSRAASERTC